jgi:hypothetical protein
MKQIEKFTLLEDTPVIATDNTFISDLIENIVTKLRELKDDELIERLKEFGHAFENQEEFKEFLKTRCRLEKHPANFYMFYADDKLVGTWTENINLEFEGNKVTAIFG